MESLQKYLQKTMKTLLTGELQRLRHEMEMAADRTEREKEGLQQKLTTSEREYQAAVQQARQAHQEDITRLTDLKACWHRFLVTHQCLKKINQGVVIQPVAEVG